MLSSAMEAGLPLRSAVTTVAESLEGPCAEDLRRLASSLAAGVPDSRAWNDLASVEVWRDPAQDVSRAVDSGEGISELLSAHAAQLQVAAAEKTEKKARKAGVDAIGPLVCCHLPAFCWLAWCRLSPEWCWGRCDDTGCVVRARACRPACHRLSTGGLGDRRRVIHRNETDWRILGAQTTTGGVRHTPHRGREWPGLINRQETTVSENTDPTTEPVISARSLDLVGATDVVEPRHRGRYRAARNKIIDRGMATAEYAVGMLAAVALALVLLKVVTHQEVFTKLLKLVVSIIGKAGGMLP